MNLLLDTHTLLWWLGDDAKLPRKAHEAIASGENEIFVSAVSLWEIRLKESVGKIKTPKSLVKAIQDQGFNSLEVTWRHTDSINNLPFIHQDPFDRLLIVQAQLENLSLVTKDPLIKKYKVQTLWN